MAWVDGRRRPPPNQGWGGTYPPPSAADATAESVTGVCRFGADCVTRRGAAAEEARRRRRIHRHVLLAPGRDRGGGLPRRLCARARGRLAALPPQAAAGGTDPLPRAPPEHHHGDPRGRLLL